MEAYLIEKNQDIKDVIGFWDNDEDIIPGIDDYLIVEKDFQMPYCRYILEDPFMVILDVGLPDEFVKISKNT